jgi:hypothetical protein
MTDRFDRITNATKKRPWLLSWLGGLALLILIVSFYFGWLYLGTLLIGDTKLCGPGVPCYDQD